MALVAILIQYRLERDGQKDGWRDGQTQDDRIYRASIALCCKNRQWMYSGQNSIEVYQ